MTTEPLSVGRAIANATEMSPEKLRSDLLLPWPRITWRTTVTVLLLLAVLIWGVNGTNARPSELVEGIPNILDFIRRLFPPRFDLVPVTLALPAFPYRQLALPAQLFSCPKCFLPLSKQCRWPSSAR